MILKVTFKKRNGLDGESTLDQLMNMILPELDKLLINIDNSQLPPKEDRYLLFYANAFKVWNWNMNKPSEIYIRLAKLNDNYSKI